MRPELSTAIRAWVSEARAVLVCCEKLADWYGDEGDSARLNATMEYLRESILIAERYASGDLDLKEPKPRPRGKLAHFACGKRVAEALSPLLEMVVSKEPEFVSMARAELSEEEASKLVGCYGNFFGAISHFWCGDIWNTYPEYAPQEWSVRRQ
jgi:hypothetical protein